MRSLLLPLFFAAIRRAMQPWQHSYSLLLSPLDRHDLVVQVQTDSIADLVHLLRQQTELWDCFWISHLGVGMDATDDFSAEKACRLF